jgi:hypothetical protein
MISTVLTVLEASGNHFLWSNSARRNKSLMDIECFSFYHPQVLLGKL